MHDILSRLVEPRGIDGSIEHTTETFHLRESRLTRHCPTEGDFATWDEIEDRAYDIERNGFATGHLHVNVLGHDDCTVVRLSAFATTCCLEPGPVSERPALTQLIDDCVAELFDGVELRHSLGYRDALFTTISTSCFSNASNPRELAAQQVDIVAKLLSALDVVETLHDVTELVALKTRGTAADADPANTSKEHAHD